MNEHTISPDDPRLTAYALNEMEPDERTEFEQLLRGDTAAQKIVESITATTATLSRSLAQEELPDAPSLAAAAIIPGGELRKLDGGPLRSAEDPYPKARPFPYFWVSGLAAACFTLGFAIWQLNYKAPEARHYTEIDLNDIVPAQPVPSAGDKDDARLIAIGQAAEEERAKLRQQRTAAGGVAVQLPVVKTDAPAATISLPPDATALAARSFGNETVVSGISPAARPLDLSSISAETAPSQGKGSVAVTLDAGQIHFGDAVKPETPATGSHLGSVAAGETIRLEAFTVSADTRARGNRAAAKAPAPAVIGGGAAGAVIGGAIGSIQEAGKRRAMNGESDALFRPADREFNTEAYDRVTDNPFNAVAQNPLSTFSIDVDTASYANLRRFIQGGSRPPRDAVRIEELVNYFPYDYAAPEAKEVPFATSMEVASAPWKPEHRLARIGLKGREVPLGERGAANLVFLLDVSGSMNEPNKLPLVRESMQMLVDKLRDDDRVAIAVYAGASGLALPSTVAKDKAALKEAIDALRAGGSTNGAMGIQLAYDIAKANFIPGGINRVVLCTDGDFNVGVTNRGDLERLIEEKAGTGVFLTVLGFGMGNYKDSTLEKLADKGNGNYGYVDTRREAQKLLVEQAGGTLVTIAKDVKIQVEFNPAQVQAYRLIGYENRMLRKEDFNNDKIDAGEIGSGHTVTALYEVVPVGVEWQQESTVDPLKYQKTEGRGRKTDGSGELLTLKLRYKAPDGDASRLLEFPLRDSGAKFAAASADFKFAAAVAAFGMILRDSPHKGGATLADVTDWATAGTGRDAGGYRSEFLGLVKLSEALVR